MRKSVGALLSFGIATVVGMFATPPPVFAGTPFSSNSVPGRIEAENFDTDGAGIAYHDSTPENEPGAYRTEGVDIEASSSALGGYDVGWVTPGEWLTYTLNVTSEASYVIEIRHASQGPGGTIHIEFDGVDQTGPIVLADTGSWQIWRTTVVPGVSLRSGQRVMRVMFDSGNVDGWLANIDSILVWNDNSGQLPWNGTRPSVPGKIEAENYDQGGEGVAYHDSTAANEAGAYRTDGVDIEVTSDAGGGYDVGWIRPGEWLEYSVKFVKRAYYSVEVRYASQGYGGTMHVEVGGRDVSGPIELTDTGGWQMWGTAWSTGDTFLYEGNATVRLVFDSGNSEGWLANINYVRLHEAQWPFLDEHPYIISKNRTTRIEAEYYDFGGEGVAYHDSDDINEPGVFRTHEGVDVEQTLDIDGRYDVGWIRPGEWLVYFAEVFQPGPYDVRIRYAADGYGGTMHIEYDGVDVTGPVALPDSGGWQTWATVTVRNVMLLDRTPGSRLRLVFDSGNADGWLANINWFEFVAAAQ